jgi:hypothetical protein
MRTTTLVLALIVTAPVLDAQSHHHPPAPVSATALRQIRDVEKATARLATTERAAADGYESVLGWIPLMGTHWVHGPRMLEGRGGLSLNAPAQLMFSPVGGKETLVGLAYAYYAPIKDKTPPPALFDGAPAWHDHPDLSPPGTNMLMLHVWLVPSPDGPFAGENPFLPWWAAGVTPPDVERMHDQVVSERVRRATLAFAEVADPNGWFPVIAKRPPVRSVLDERIAAVKALIPEIEAARKAKDQARWDSLVDTVGTHWEAMAEAYLKSAVNPDVNARIARAIADTIKGGRHHRP